MEIVIEDDEQGEDHDSDWNPPPEVVRELRANFKEHESPIRYVLGSDIFRGLHDKRKRGDSVFFFNASDDTWGPLNNATCLKMREYAEAIASVLDKGQDRHLIAKVTVKDGARRILKYRA